MEKYKKHIKEYQDFPIDGINYLDLNPIYKMSGLRRDLVVDICDQINDGIDLEIFPEFDYIGVVESRGYLLGSLIAQELNKGIVCLRSKPNRLPGETAVVKHTLEYGDAQMECQMGEGSVMIFDDVYATGGTFFGAAEVLKKAGYTPVSGYFIVELDYIDAGENPYPIGSIIQYE
jgi:adenine phosphoribosyltransferase